MAKDTLIDEHVSENQCEKAVKALLAHALKHEKQKEQTELLGGREQHVWLNITVKHMQPQKKLKPFKIPLDHPLVDPRTSPICLITKDPQREYKDLLETHNIRFISRVVGIEKLKGKFKPFEARRLLLKENGLFLADERVVPLLPGLLGNAFFKAKKQPIPVNLTRKNLKGELEAAISSTYFHQNQGTNSSVKIGTLSLTSPQILANFKKALPAVVKHIKGGWDNIQSLQVKTSFSTALPIWSCELGSEVGARWDGLVADVEASDGENVSGGEGDGNEEGGGVEEAMQVEVPRRQTRATAKKEVEKEDNAKGKKRAAEGEGGVEVEKPKKKVKSSTAEVKTTTVPPKPILKKQKAPPNPELELQASLPSDSPPVLKATKKRKAKAAQKESDETSTAPITIVPASSKPAPSVQPPASPDLPTSELPADEPAKKKRKRKHAKKAGAELPSAETPKPPPIASEPISTPATAPATEDAPSKKRRRKAKKVEVDNVAPSVSAVPPESTPAENQGSSAPVPPLDSNGPTPEEVKQKRRWSSVEKKKAKVLKGKRIGETVKEGLIGKKGL